MKPRPILFCALLALCPPAFACKPVFSPHPVADFIAQRSPQSVIFMGDVVSISDKQDNGEDIDETIVFHPVSRWSGPVSGDIVVRGHITRQFVTDCAGLGDFSAGKGERWLVFGTSRDGMVDPRAAISMKLVNGAIPRSTLALLKKIRKVT